MTTQYYDAVVVGMELGPLAAGALLAKRGFRVLVAGQEAPFDRYTCFGYEFSRRPFMLTSAESPAIQRVIAELSLGQLYQHLADTPRPAYQVVLPKARVDVHREPPALVAELQREFPGAARSAGSVLEAVGRVNGEMSKFLANDMVLPPETFFEKREYARAEVQNPFRSARDADLLAGLADAQGLREILEIPGRLETGGVQPASPFVFYRQIGGWLFDCQKIRGGRDGLRRLLGERIVGQGGDLHERQRVTEIAVTKGRVMGVRMAGRDEMIGCRIVLTDRAPPELTPLISPSAWPKRFSALLDESPPPVLGYAVNLGVDPQVVPAGLAHTAFVSFGPGMGDQLIRIEQIPQPDEDKAALHVSCVGTEDAQEAIRTGALRDALLDRVRWLVPFLDNYLEVIHSPFDGFGPIDLGGAAKGEAPAVPHPEEVPKWLIRPPLKGGGPLGAENLPYRTGIKGLLFAGSQVISGLGTEGELIAAWGAARIAGKTDPNRERLVRSMRSKVEL